MKNSKIILIIFLIVSVTIQSQEISDKRDGKIFPSKVVKAIEERIKEDYAPSIAIATIDSTGIRYFNFGKTTKGGKEVNENTIYEIGSITKVFTGILLAQQVLDGDLKLEDEINKFLPYDITVPVLDDTEITFGNLTDHTSGFPRIPANLNPTNPSNPYADYTVTQMYEYISDYQPVRAVGSEYEYSNLAQGLLGHLLALNKDSTYEELVVQTIANPLGMDDTRIELTNGMMENLALGHSDGQIVENWDLSSLAGAGALKSSTSDMAKFISANLGYINTPLTEAIKLSHKVRHDKAGDMRVAMGWHIKKGNNGDVIWHNGGTGGYRSFIGFVKETGQGIVLLSNSSQGSDDIGFYLLDQGSELADLKFKSDIVDISESTLEQYVGLYELQPKFKISITKDGKQLFAQPTGQDRFEIYPENNTVFFLTVVDAKITFNIKNGVVESLSLIQGEQETLGKKIE